MLANRAGEGGGGEGRRGGLINSISQASAFFTDVRSIFLPFLRGWRLIVENRSVVIGKLDSREKKSSYSFEVNIHSSDPNRSEKHRRKKIVRVIFPTSFTSFDSILPFCSSFFLYIYLSLHCSSLVAVFPFSPFPLLESITTEKPLHSTLIEGDRWARRITRCMVMIRGRRTATCTLRKIGKIPNRDWNRRGRTWRNVSPLERRKRERDGEKHSKGCS